MNHSPKRFLTFLTIGTLSLSFGCIHWDPGWKVEAPEGDASASTQELLDEAASYEKMAGTAESLERLSHIYAEVLKSQPELASAWLGLGRTRLFLGAGFARSIGEKGEIYRQALEAIERSMSSNPDFRMAYSNFDDIDSFPVDALVASQGEAARLWALGVVLYVDECMSELVKMTNSNYLDMAARVASQMADVDQASDAGFGSLVKGIVTSLKSKNEIVTAAGLFDQAIAKSPDSPLFHWARARFLYAQHKDGPHAEKDLRFVIESDPDAASGGYILNAYLQANAKLLVRKIGNPLTL